MYHKDRKFDEQPKYANDMGIPYVWFLPEAQGGAHRGLDIATGQQADADPASWVA